jgi:hypothetical protein
MTAVTGKGQAAAYDAEEHWARTRKNDFQMRFTRQEDIA